MTAPTGLAGRAEEGRPGALSLAEFMQFLEGELESLADVSLSPDRRFEDLGFDSLHKVQLLAAIEDLGTILDEHAIGSIHTPREAYVAYVAAVRRDRVLLATTGYASRPYRQGR